MNLPPFFLPGLVKRRRDYHFASITRAGLIGMVVVGARDGVCVDVSHRIAVGTHVGMTGVCSF